MRYKETDAVSHENIPMTDNTHITAAQFRELAHMVYQESGIYLPESKLGLLKARIAKRLRVLRIDTASEYISLIRGDAIEFGNFIDAVTTNHTFFFRENSHCEFILKHMDNSRHIDIWSAACSSGEEPYTIAVQLMNRSFRFSIHASDISNSVLQIARNGIYPIERAQKVPPRILQKYFQKGHNKYRGHIRVVDEVKKRVSFAKHNLITDSPPQRFDIIFCRNVMIYFDRNTRQKVSNTLRNAMKSNGYLIVGMSESLRGIEHGLRCVAPGVYQDGRAYMSRKRTL